MILAAVGAAAARLLPAGPAGTRNVVARAAVGIALLAWSLFGLTYVAPGQEWLAVVSLAGWGAAAPLLGVAGTSRVARAGERRLAVAGLVAGLTGPVLDIAAFLGCLVSDVCFH